MLKSMLVVFVC